MGDAPFAMATIEQFPQRQGQDRSYRTPPHNLEAEQALLGAILINNDAFDRVSDFLRSEHFIEEFHRRIFEIAGSMIRMGKFATPITLKTFLGEHDLGGVTVPQYLARLASEATTIINAYDYGRGVYDLAMRRELIAIGEDVVNVAYDAPVDSSPRDQIEEAERRLYQIAEAGRYDGGFQRFSEALKIAFNIAKAYQGRTRADGSTETANGGVVGFFALEMSAEQLATRIIAEQSGVASYKIRRGDITEGDFHQVAEAVRDMQQIPFFIDQTGGVSIAQLTARARRLKRQRGLDLLVVDYLQLLSGSKSRVENRVQE